MTRKEKLLAIAKKGLYAIARGGSSPQHIAQRTLADMAKFKAKTAPSDAKGGEPNP